jgi:hypothetical protein
MARESKVSPGWVEEFRARWLSPSEEELERRKEAVARALEIRKHLKIAPLTTGELVRSIRDRQ